MEGAHLRSRGLEGVLGGRHTPQRRHPRSCQSLNTILSIRWVSRPPHGGDCSHLAARRRQALETKLSKARTARAPTPIDRHIGNDIGRFLEPPECEGEARRREVRRIKGGVTESQQPLPHSGFGERQDVAFGGQIVDQRTGLRDIGFRAYRQGGKTEVMKRSVEDHKDGFRVAKDPGHRVPDGRAEGVSGLPIGRQGCARDPVRGQRRDGEMVPEAGDRCIDVFGSAERHHDRLCAPAGRAKATYDGTVGGGGPVCPGSNFAR